MRTVIYTHDLEPITVIELSEFMEECIRKRGEVRLAIQLPVSVTANTQLNLYDDVRPLSICLTGQPIRINNCIKFLVFTRDEESALLLKAVFLPGQYRQVHEGNKKAFAEGVLAAFSNMGDY